MRNLLAATAMTTFIAFGNVGFAQETAEPNAATVVATVNGTEITLGHVIMLRRQLPEEYRNLPDDVLWEGIISQIVEQTLLADGVDSENLPLEVVLSLENEKRAQLASVRVERIIEDGIDDATLEALYAETVATMEPTPEFNASHILVETEEEAQALVDELNAGKDFAELAQEKSTGPSGPNGGNLGWFGLGMMVPEFETAVTGMEAGDISAPVQTQFGWHVIKLNEYRETPVPSLEELRPQLVNSLSQDTVQTAIEALTEAAQITRVEGLDPALMRDVSLLSE